MGFWKGLESGWDSFTKEFEEASEAVGHFLGRALPWTALIGGLGLVALLLLGVCHAAAASAGGVG